PTSYGSQDPALKTDLENLVGQVLYNTTGKPLSSVRLQEMLADVDGMIAGLDEIDAQALEKAAHLKIVARYGVGYNNVDLEAARKQGIIVTNTPGANAVSVAELTIALILNLLRPVIPAVKLTKTGEWPRFKGYSLEGKTVGLLGLGAIGKETARRLIGFGCKILAYDLYPDEKFAAEHGITLSLLDDILPTADIISLHLPGTPETKEIVNKNFLGKMKPGAWLVNTARGDLIQETALVKALEEGHLRGAALDVYPHEPPDKNSPLLLMDQVICTPHMGAHSDSATNAMGRMALAECLAVLRGEEPKYQVN
ncbi:MAG: phosphoglycerate dehydrogenase, partial [Anaerolineales bacterium]|nr:phosphoglycerate dehydrogenase [Anaerolineales bacterium]